MTLFIDQSGNPDFVSAHLFVISRDDATLGDTAVAGDTTVVQVTYTETAGQGPSADRLSQLVNTNLGMPVVMTALPGGTDPHTGLDVTGNGFTFIDSTSGTSIVRVVYDDTQCNGSGIFTFDTSGNHITTPGPVILYHELSHALRAANGTSQTNDEPPAEIDENVLRTSLGLCQRDINNHGGGCGAGSTCGGNGEDVVHAPNEAGCDCFIVSAATGSPDSWETTRLKQTRDRVLRASWLGGALMDAVYRDYYRFSPAVAARVRADSGLREETRVLVVGPLLAWYAVAEAICLAPDDTPRLHAALRDLLRRARESATRLTNTEGESGQPVLRAAARQAGAGPYTDWAVMDPLRRISHCHALFAPVAHPEHDTTALLNQVRAWLAEAPLERLCPPPADQLDDDLAFLAHGAFADPDTRRALGDRLAAAWPHAIPALRDHGYLAEGDTP